MSVAENLASIRRQIQQSGRNPDEVTIVAVTKAFPASACQEALDAGLVDLGENRVKEALQKMAVVSGAGWHLIGHLQTNKVRQAAGRFALIQTIDSLRLAEAVAMAAPSQPALIEVNVAREPQRSGVEPSKALELIRAAGGLVDLRGVMGIGPAQGDPSPAFRDLARIRDEAQQAIGRPLPILSIGMSGDFQAALAAGSTMLRLGQALFGPRLT